LIETLHIVWTVAAKDIVDALRSKLVISLILTQALILLMPRMLSWAIVPPYTQVLVYDPGRSRLLVELENSSQFQVQTASSMAELEQVIGSSGSGLGVEVGLAIPAAFDQNIESGEQLIVDGYVAWGGRTRATELTSAMEGPIAELLGRPVRIEIEGNVVYPPPDLGLLLGLSTLTVVTIMLVMGMQLVPALLFEEKQTKTMDALLVSPASIGQVVVGKALAGLFYVLVTAGVVFALNWVGVVHWGVTILFVIGIGVFAVAVGLLLGSFFERQQDLVGWMMLLLILLIGSMFVEMMDMSMPASIQAVVGWVPSVTLAEIYGFAFIKSVPWAELWPKLGSVLGISLLLYSVVVWKVRRSDR
jgi:ABC-2 type transport system permease protein